MRGFHGFRREVFEIKRGQVFQDAFAKLGPSQQNVPLREPRLGIQMIDENASPPAGPLLCLVVVSQW